MPKRNVYMTLCRLPFRQFPVAGTCASNPLRGRGLTTPASLFVTLLLSGCGGILWPSGTSHVTYSKSPDGVETIEIHDGKDRSSFTTNIQRSDGSTLTIESTDANGSTAQAQVLAAQQQTMEKLVELVKQLEAKK